jgi:hypothetical protein
VNTDRLPGIAHCLSFACVLWLFGCGTQKDGDIPPELLAAIAQRDVPAADYPAGPTGGNVGDIAENRCIRAWRDPRKAGFAPEKLEPLCLGDFWDEAAAEHQLLLVNTAAIWCQACQVEYSGNGARGPLTEEVALRRKVGLRIFGSLFQDGQFNPATDAHAVTWARTFDVNFPFGVDTSFEFGAFASADVQPLNMVVDTRTMRILLKAQDVESAWELIDATLSR